MRAVFGLIGLLLVGACASTPDAPETVVRTVEVRIPVAVPCRVEIGPEPIYSDSEEALAAAPDVFEAIKLRIAGREQRRAWSAIQAVALAGCSGTHPEEPTRP